MKDDPSPLKPWIPIAELPKRYPELAPSLDSARWQRRVNAPELVKHGAITAVCGRIYVHPERWAAAAIEGGQRMVAARARGRIEAAVAELDRPLERA